MSATTHAVAAYVLTILLLWGYALTLWLSARRLRTSHGQDKSKINPGRSDPS